ncbi:MAG TPA: hypothetical protein VFW45_12980 [Candidatus Polarisedimenticolia bacterium]|nr:hypothetical protein [Candidatus Polarisedimenticolia bacterium]
MRIYRRSAGTRALALGCLVLFTLLEISYLTSGGRFVSFPGIFLACFIGVSLFVSLLNLGDRFLIDDSGIRYANPLLARMGLSLDRSVVWPEIVSIHAHRALRFGRKEDNPSALFLEVRGSDRFVIDSVEEFEEIHRLVVERCNGAAYRGHRPP